jgi:hypothetical protein
VPDEPGGPDVSEARGTEAGEAERTVAGGLRVPPPLDVPPPEGAVIAAAAVPLAARRVPIAEPQQRAAPSPFDLLHAEPPASREAQAELADVAAAVPLAPSTAAGARGPYPPAPAQPAAQAATIRAPSRAAPSVGRTEPVGRREPGADDGYRKPPRKMASTLRLLAAAVVIVAGLIFIATRLFGSSSPPAPSSHSAGAAAQNTHHAASSGPLPSSVTVAVLNGTNTAHLASGAWTRLAARGYRQGAVANAPSQTVAASSVGYTHGHRSAALEVARDLSLGSGAVAPVHRANLADAERNGRRPQVVVTLGGDYTRR